VLRRKQNIATSSREDKGGRKNLKGTGGTALMPFLKQARDETGEPAIEAWTRKLMNKTPSLPGKGDFFLGKVDEHADGDIEVTGLAGTWTMDSDGGGLCHY
jgi:indoleamine 2,3-dioxygenase